MCIVSRGLIHSVIINSTLSDCASHLGRCESVDNSRAGVKSQIRQILSTKRRGVCSNLVRDVDDAEFSRYIANNWAK